MPFCGGSEDSFLYFSFLLLFFYTWDLKAKKKESLRDEIQCKVGDEGGK